MNAAEITDKLGLHSLRQRAWVSFSTKKSPLYYADFNSTFNPPVLPLEMVFMKVWSGLHKLSERLVISKFGVLFPCNSIVFPSFQTIERPYHNVFISTIGAPSHESSQSLRFYWAATLHLALRTSQGFSLFCAFFGLSTFLHLALPSCVSAWYKKQSVDGGSW
jgi:hypothetical protein